jgi:hypothetical protein
LEVGTQAPRPRRPIGVTIISILEIILGVFDILFGLILLLLFTAVGAIFEVVLATGLGVLLVPVGLLFLALGIASFFVAYGLWTGRGWAWVFSILAAILGIAFYAVGSMLGDYVNILPLTVYTLMLIYLFTPGVRAFFGRVPAALVRPWPAPRSFEPAAYRGPIQGQPRYPPSQASSFAQAQRPVYGLPRPQYAPQPQYLQPTYQQPSAYQQPFAWSMAGICPNCRAPSPMEANFCDRCGTRMR